MLLKLMSPLRGWCAPLDEVPDAVFSGRMLGDGLAIDPTDGVVVAPCDGEILTLPDSGHAVSIRNAQGLEILIHVGIDTVQLGGRGFVASVRPGDQVKTGDLLIRFDLDIVARTAKSLMSPIVVTSDGMALQNRRAPGLTNIGELLFEVTGADLRAPVPVTAAGGGGIERAFPITLQQGLHARPAALIARRAKAFDTQVLLAANGRSADARSIVAIMALGVRHGDTICLRADGSQAAQAVAAVISGIEEARELESRHASMPEAAPAAAVVKDLGSGLLAGVCAVRGIAVGRATRIERREIEVSEAGSDAKHERQELDRARANVRSRLERMRATGGVARQDIIAAHVEFLDDPTLNESARQLIDAGKSAGFAWRGATRQSIQALQTLDDVRLRERIDDLLDVESHVLLALAGEARPLHLPLPEQAVLLADDLLPSELTALDQRRLVAIALSAGGATSHVAILAAAMGIPMLIGIGPALRGVPDGRTVIVDADGGSLHPEPDAEALAKAKAAIAERVAQSRALRLAAAKECHTLDGTRIEVFANLGSSADAVAGVANGAEGCGLLRTEFLFIDRDTAPSEDEQLESYQSIADTLGGRPLILRMMDVGGDKPLRYLPLPPEENPALGMRGVRSGLLHRNLMRTQLRAALRVQPAGVVRLLVPMVTDVGEILAVRGVMDELAAELGHTAPISLGAMIETPAAALTAASLMGAVDFLSVGSNDLTQYTLAMDRGHSELARRTDALHPAVLQLIAAAAGVAQAAGKLIAVCGGVAADHTAVPILLGLGIRELSVVPAAIPALKDQIGGLRLDVCRDLAKRCLALGSASEVRDLVERTLTDLGETT